MNLTDFNSKDLAIDFGTSNVLVGIKEKGIVLKEPSILAADQRTNEILEIGSKAIDLINKSPDTVKAIKPFKDGVIADYTATITFLKRIFKMVSKQIIMWKPRVLIGVPVGISEIEMRAIIEVLLQAGAGEVYLVHEPIAAGVGLNLNVIEANGNLIMDIGGGRTQVAVISLGQLVTSKSAKIGGHEFDQAIIDYLKKKLDFGISQTVAENLKIELGCATPLISDLSRQVKGIETNSGIPKNLNISSRDMHKATESYVKEIIDLLIDTLSETPPELSADILRNGIYLIGGGSNIRNLDNLIAQTTGIQTYLSKDSNESVIKGLLKILNNQEKYKNLILNK